MIQDKKLGIVVGHSPKKPGAYNKQLKVKEYKLNEELSLAIMRECIKRNILFELIFRENGYQQLPYDINKRSVDYCICVHHNSSSKKHINGTETLYYANSKTSKKFAQAVNDKMVEHLGYRDRGLLPKSSGNGTHVLKNTSMPCILIEPYFMSNKVAVINRNIQTLASAIVDGYENFLKDK